MALTRKHRRQQRRLRKDAQELLDQQRLVLGNAGDVLQEATKHAKSLSNEYVSPRIDDAAAHVRPYVKSGVSAAKRAGDQVRLFSAPLVAAALARTIKTLDQLESGDTAKQLRSFGESKGLLKPKKKKRAGGILAASLGIAAAAAVGYALWQAFRTDDELWVAPED